MHTKVEKKNICEIKTFWNYRYIPKGNTARLFQCQIINLLHVNYI